MAEGWSLILHGGAKEIRPEKRAENRAGLEAALAVGRTLLEQGFSALNVVEAVVRKLEELPVFNAGFGSVRNEEGEIELDASIMDGRTLEIGAVAGLKEYKHPVTVARALLSRKSILLVGEGAQRFAEMLKVEKLTPLPAPQEAAQAGDTVGCVALDGHGDLAVATSTGGLEGAVAGRVGDVPLPGCGFYADNERGAVSLSGEGEAIARVMLAAETLARMQKQSLDSALEDAVGLLKRVEGEAGIIAIHPSGRLGFAHNTANFAVAFASHDDRTGQVCLSQAERR
jgi:beta-aspartyl-peptidase (threonine type)